MPTIKTQVTNNIGRVLTKIIDGNRKISCSCCEQFCCMYPAQLLTEGIITWEDLPEEINIFDLDGVIFSTMQRIDPPIEDSGIIVYYEESGNGYDDGGNYLYSIGEDFYIVFLGGSIFQPSCIFMPPENFRIQDLFEYSYQINGPINGTVVRQELCIWTGDGFTLRYRSQEFPNSPPYIANVAKWELIDQENNNFIKAGFQDSPTGSYSGGYSVS